MPKTTLPLAAIAATALLTTMTAAQAGKPDDKPEQNGPPGKVSLVQKAIAINTEGPYAGQFDTLVAAVLAADPVVINTLSSNGQHTVFAPTDEAFMALGLDPDNIGSALPQATLTAILSYHVTHGRRTAEDVLDSMRLRTLYTGDGDAFLDQAGGVLTDNLGRTATIIVTDVEATNGVIHAIDAVVLPALP